MREDPKAIVRDGCDSCGPRYNAARARDPSPELEALLEVLPPKASVLDIGCGGGHPVASTRASGRSDGVDMSPVQIEAARTRLPAAEFIVGDILSRDFEAASFEAASFEAIVSFYAIFHLPREEHGTLLERTATWLRPEGIS